MGILDRIRRNSRKRIMEFKNTNNQNNETYLDKYERESIQKKEKFYNIITNNQNVENIINNQFSTEYLKYALTKLNNNLSLKEERKSILVNLLNERIKFVETNVYKPHNDKIEIYLKELDVLKKELVELENEKVRKRELLDNVSKIEHYSNSGYVVVYEELREAQKKINFKKEEIKSKLRYIQKERDILKSFNLI